ncbi:zinc-ribbon domain-containing protein [Glycomyces sp. NPDC021274]|uniref:zinc-ribbon domain-containing protein n=1 Tax=Glycomyces sp. NPDC021274 TaxID=3155120 RepID=UPI0033DF7B98
MTTSSTSRGQECSELLCTNPTAFRTRSRPAWCDAHITQILRRGGVEPLEPFATPKAYRLTKCLTCGCEAHYRFEYTLEKNAVDEATCRACYWRQWGEEARQRQGFHPDDLPIPASEVKAKAEASGFEYLGALTDPSMREDPHLVRCRGCGRQSAERLGDIGWGCSCQNNRKSSSTPTAPKGSAAGTAKATRAKTLFKDSGLSAVAWWDHEVNDPAWWATATPKARREVAWCCPECGLRFTAKVLDMTFKATCPDCEEKRRAAFRVEYEQFKTTPVFDVPELLAAWADEADPRTVMVTGTHGLFRFRCSSGHHPRVDPYRYLGSGCPTCKGQATRATNRAAADADPASIRINPEIASQWHPSKNGRLRLAEISPDSRRKVWWRDPNCGHEWQDTTANRDKYARLRCPQCRTILDSLAYHYPELAAEWAPENPLTAWHVRPFASTNFVPAWVCSTDPGHRWQAALASRSNGAGCPECREHGKSQVELEYCAAVERAFGTARSGELIRHNAFQRRSSWTVDISVELADGRRLAIEYDGAYWHADKADIDRDKSIDLLAAGFVVVRLREHPLGPLPVQDRRYIEFTVYATAPEPEGVIAQVRQWALDQLPQS